MRPPKVSSLLYKSRFIQLFTNYQSPSGMEESPSASFAYIITQKGKAGNSIKITYLLCLTFTLKMLQSKNFGKEDIVKEPYAQEGCLSRSITPPRG